MNRHNTTYSDACRLARAAVRCRIAGDEAAARVYESRALALVGALPAAKVTEMGQRGSLAARGEAFGQEAAR